ncbi:nitric oxide synthase oxygenase [Deinococcus multiflagellatus]|uniref:Nitric oxide synthase oxygenase n=1 Tax=Deinococcus multiflagellatus TaxID=1656887 RepID=A0ABW1ZKP0_9DEIO
MPLRDIFGPRGGQHGQDACAPPARCRPPHELQEALAFLEAYHAETGAPGLAQRRQEVLRGGHLTLSSAELTHGARMAWRHSTRCVGRLPWASLQVRDLRQVTAAPEVFAHLCDHLRAALNGGRILPILSVFGPGVRLHNDQLIRYAGYRQPDGTVRGDPQNVALTGHLQRLGWAGGRVRPLTCCPWR